MALAWHLHDGLCTFCGGRCTIGSSSQCAVAHPLLRLPHRAHTALRLPLQPSWTAPPLSLPATHLSHVLLPSASPHPLHSYAVLNSTNRGEGYCDSWPGITAAVMIVRGMCSPEQPGALLLQLPGLPRGAPSPRGPSPATEGGLLRPPTWPALPAVPALAAGTSPGQACPGRPAAASAAPRLVV